MVNEIENSDVGLDDPIAEDQQQQRDFQQQTQVLRRKARELAKQKAKQQVKKVAGKAAKKAVKKTIKKLIIQGIIWFFGLLAGTIEIWLPILLAIIAIIYIAINVCSIPGFSIVTSVGSLFSDKAELVNNVCNSLGGSSSIPVPDPSQAVFESDNAARLVP